MTEKKYLYALLPSYYPIHTHYLLRAHEKEWFVEFTECVRLRQGVFGEVITNALHTAVRSLPRETSGILDNAVVSMPRDGMIHNMLAYPVTVMLTQDAALPSMLLAQIPYRRKRRGGINASSTNRIGCLVRNLAEIALISTAPSRRVELPLPTISGLGGGRTAELFTRDAKL